MERVEPALSADQVELLEALGDAGEAVTVQAADGRTLYANAAAARLLGLEDPADITRAEPGEIMSRFDVYDERGRPITVAELPGSRRLVGERPGPLLVRNVVRSTGEERWLLTKTTTLAGADGELRIVVNVIEDVTQVKRAELRQELLASAGEVLASSLDYAATLERIARLAVPGLADWCGVELPGEDGVLESVAVAHVDPERVALARRLLGLYPLSLSDPQGPGAVIRTGVPEVATGIADEALAEYADDDEHLALLRAVGFSATMVVPMRAGRETLGALTFVVSRPGRAFDEADLALALELGRRAGTAVLNARLFTERSTIAHTLQQGLLPDDLPQMPGWATASLYRPAGELSEVGGDFYGAFDVDGGWMAVIGDVTGHGAEAAALTALARYTLRSSGQLSGDPARAILQLNRTLCDRAELSVCSAVCARVADGAEGAATVELASAGHPLPLLVRGGDVRPVGAGEMLAGARPDAAYTATTVELAPGDLLVLFTDGLLDTVGDGERFGEERLASVLRDGPRDAAGAVDNLAREIDAFRRGRLRDDVAVLVLERLG